MGQEATDIGTAPADVQTGQSPTGSQSASWTCSVVSAADSAMKPAVSPLDRHRKSGDTSACPQANSVPVRPKPTAISSAMTCTSNSSHGVRRPARYSG